MGRSLHNKSVSMLVSKLRTAVASSERGRDLNQINLRREEIKTELIARGEAALEEVIPLLLQGDALSHHAADVIGYIGAEHTVKPLATILAGEYPQTIKRAVAVALEHMDSDNARLALKIWRTRQELMLQRLLAFMQHNEATPPLLDRLNWLAMQRKVSPYQVADAWILEHSDQQLSPDAEQRLRTLHLTPRENALLEATLLMS
ncbi:MAG: hypothetical protein ACOYLB_15130 [Phototrophicaceae bacterium]